MDTSETNIKMYEKAEEVQEVMSKYDGHLLLPDDQIYYKADPYPVAVVYSNQLRCPNCNAYLSTPYCAKDGGKASTMGAYNLQFGGPCSKDLKECKITWLPRQDQLQEMMGLSDRQLMKRFRGFLVWITGVKGTMPYGIFLPSFEQLWLAFVMKEKYNKVWDGENWVKEK